MRCLLIYPKFPRTFWSFERVLELVGRKVLVSPLGLPTVAALLPDSWEFKLVDRNIRPVTEDEWAWADIVLLSAMIVQRADMADQISEAKKRGKPVAVGGPYPTSVPEDMERAGADYLVLDEAELTLPLFLEALEKGETGGTFTAEGEKPDVTSTPVPRFDLYELEAYDTMAIQYSRGCPFLCEFCDIITLYGRRPRTKSPQQILAELDLLYELGWRRSILMVDDNFIGNKKNAKQMLRELLEWQKEKGYPFTFNTEASIDLAEDKELMRLMVACNFDSVFLGIETPDEEALTITRKYQNTRNPMADSVQTLIEHGLRPMGGFIIGFDGEKRGAGDRIVQFINDTAIPTANFSMLQALPNTALWDRLTKENRLLNTDSDINQTSLPNYVPQRPMEELAHEYVEAFAAVYDP
ncbi:MAG: B12-binding domain-containing radical SAM protein, partial [Methylococcales bacterium]|nr:B12-binding domain-containing radical SAM protein [Methylococcales bacterium]